MTKNWSVVALLLAAFPVYADNRSDVVFSAEQGAELTLDLPEGVETAQEGATISWNFTPSWIEASVKLRGMASADTALFINDHEVRVYPDGGFEHRLRLKANPQPVHIELEFEDGRKFSADRILRCPGCDWGQALWYQPPARTAGDEFLGLSLLLMGGYATNADLFTGRKYVLATNPFVVQFSLQGAYYLNSTLWLEGDVAVAPSPADSRGDEDTYLQLDQAIQLSAAANYEVIPQLSVGGGLNFTRSRFLHTWKTDSVQTAKTTQSSLYPFIRVGARFRLGRDWEWTPKVTWFMPLQIDLTSGNLSYQMLLFELVSIRFKS